MEWDISLPLYGQGCRCLLNNLPLFILLIIGIVLLFELLSRARRFLQWFFLKSGTSAMMLKPKSEKDCPCCPEGEPLPPVCTHAPVALVSEERQVEQVWGRTRHC